MTKEKQQIIKEYEIIKRNLKDLSLMELLQLYFEVATDRDLDLNNVLPVDVLKMIDEVEQHLINIDQLEN